MTGKMWTDLHNNINQNEENQRNFIEDNERQSAKLYKSKKNYISKRGGMF